MPLVRRARQCWSGIAARHRMESRHRAIGGSTSWLIGPLVVNLQQAIAKRVLTPAQRARLVSNLAYDALLRASLEDRMDLTRKPFKTA